MKLCVWMVVYLYTFSSYMSRDVAVYLIEQAHTGINMATPNGQTPLGRRLCSLFYKKFCVFVGGRRSRDFKICNLSLFSMNFAVLLLLMQ